ncbi:hypothetical protein [Actinoplanes utahensis]|nr:hypothetical protein [Actinoplanes utahensis]
MKRLLPIAMGLLLAGSTVGCAGDEPAVPAVCESAEAVQRTVDHIKQTNVSENGLSALKPYVSDLLEQLNVLVGNAKAQFGNQADALRASVTALRASVDAAREDPSRDKLAAVRTSVEGVRSSARTLQDAIQQTC